MSDETFTEPDETPEQWADVRMVDPEADEWDVDVVVADGQVEYLDLRVRPDCLAGFIDCLMDDVDRHRSREILSALDESVAEDTNQDD